MVSKSTRSILDEYRQALVAILGDELDSVILYGSQARGHPDFGEDVPRQDGSLATDAHHEEVGFHATLLALGGSLRPPKARSLRPPKARSLRPGLPAA